MTEYLGVDQELPFEELVRRLPNKRYKIERFEVESLREIEKLVEHDAVPIDELPDFLKFLDKLSNRLDSIRIVEERENVDATNIRRVLNWINNLKNGLLRCNGDSRKEYEEKDSVFFVPLTAFGSAR